MGSESISLVDSTVKSLDTKNHGKSVYSDSKIAPSETSTRKHYEIASSLMAGAMAGAVAKTTIAPLDRTKINFQISSEKQYSFRRALRFIYRCWKADGVISLWRGNSATMARIIPYAAVQYASHEQWKHILNFRKKEHLDPGPRYLAGSLAGVTSVTMTYPLDLARARMAVTHKIQYRGLSAVFLKIAKEEGIFTLYRGYVPTVLGVIPYAGTSFFTYETLKKKHCDYTHGKEPLAVERLCFGACAGLLGQTSSYPLDIVRRRMQTAGITGNESVYTSVLATIRVILIKEGLVKGLYKGLSMNWIKGPIAVGISFSTFDTLQTFIRKISYFND